MSTTHDAPVPGRWRVALAGAVSLAVAMGIGRFAFTPLLPLMLHDGLIDLATASWLASANYLGYLAGALVCTFQPWIWRRVPALPVLRGAKVVRGGLVATGVLTLCMALPVPSLWPALRFAAGVASAVVFVFTSGWCLSQLSLRRASHLGGAMYAGPGAGILVSGLFAGVLVQWHRAAPSGWLVFGVLAMLLTWSIWSALGHELVAAPSAAAAPPLPGADAALPLPGADSAPPVPGADSSPPVPGADAPSPRLARPATPRHDATEIVALALAYGLAGFGYIVTATFLPVIARTAMPASVWIDLFWPIFGLGVVAGALLSTRLRVSGDLRRLLMGAYLVQAVGIGVSLVRPDLLGFALGSLLLGLPFTAITFFAMQEVRRLRPASISSFMGLLTAMYGVGQIVGPPLVALLLRRSATPAEGFARALQGAMSALLIGAAMFWWIARTRPVRRG